MNIKTKLKDLSDKCVNLFQRDEDDDDEDLEEEEQEKVMRRPTVETKYALQDNELEKLRRIARKKNIDLQDALAQAVEHYCENQNELPIKQKISDEKKENNPLLHLEGLATKSFQTLQKAERSYHGQYDEATIVR